MHLRLATLHDLPAILALVRTVVPLMRAGGNLQWNDTYPNAEIFTRDIELYQLWIAEIDHALAGVAAITTDQSPEYTQLGWDLNEPSIVVHRLAVNPSFRGQGIAAALMQQAEAVAIERGIRVLRVDTNSANVATQRLFPRLGYTFSGEFAFDSRPGLRFLGYEKRLPHSPSASLQQPTASQ